MRAKSTLKVIALSTALHFGSLPALAVLGVFAAEFGVKVSAIDSAVAQSKPKPKPRKTPAVSEKIFKGLSKVEELVSPPEESGNKPNLPAALNELAKLEKNCSKCNRYELASIYFRYAWVYATLEDYANSLKYYDLVVAQSPDIPLGIELNSLYYMAQLAMQLEQYKRSLGYLNKWMELATDVTPEAYDLKARICYQTNDKKCAMTNINKAVAMREEDGIAKEHEYNLQRALNLEGERYKVASTILEKLIRHYPKKSYWVQLSATYGILEREKDQLGALDAAYVMNGVHKEQSLINMAYLLINSGVPYRAAVVLEKGLKDKKINRNEKNLTLLANAWRQSKDVKKAIPVLEEAAKSSKTGDLYGQLVGLYLDIDDNKAAVKAGKEAIKKGVKKRPADVHMNVGIAHVNMENYKSAVNAFEKAMKDKRIKKSASSWMKYAKKEMARVESIKNAI